MNVNDVDLEPARGRDEEKDRQRSESGDSEEADTARQIDTGRDVGAGGLASERAPLAGEFRAKDDSNDSDEGVGSSPPRRASTLLKRSLNQKRLKRQLTVCAANYRREKEEATGGEVGEEIDKAITQVEKF